RLLMKELFESSVIKGFLFSVFDKTGPKPVYIFPEIIQDEDKREENLESYFQLTYKDCMQISIKNLGLLIVDDALADKKMPKPYQHFAILPYPDFQLTSLTLFRIIYNESTSQQIPSALCIMVDEKQRSFLYNNNNRLKSLLQEFIVELENQILTHGYEFHYSVKPLFQNLLMDIKKIEMIPHEPITTERKMKILFAGLDNSGKTSFLLAVDRKYSKLIGLKPTLGASISSIEALGATIFLWDLGGQSKFREKYLLKSQIYLYEADLIFYFIDIKARDRFEESIEYLQNILIHIESFNQNTPVIFILSKADPDILESAEIIDNIELLKKRLGEIISEQEFNLYTTSIFSIFSILRAFSSGLSHLSPNRDLINYNLRHFSSQAGLYLSLFLSYDGLVLADYYTTEAIMLTEISNSETIKTEGDNLRNIFEVTAPQFAMLYKIFSKFKKLKEEEAIFKIAASVILLRKVQISDFDMFLLFLVDDLAIKDKINTLLPNFLRKTQDLFLRYIA
ncbi:MAG: ADP-ribosylation factor-like protein, partial [Candidatus Hodarchaeota archaeon]